VIHSRLQSWLYVAFMVAGMGVAAAAGTDIKVIQLQNRPAEEIIPLIKPMVINAGGAVTGTGYKLIIRAQDTDITQITDLVQQLDTPPKQLRITLRQSRYGEHAASEEDISTRTGGGAPEGDDSAHADTTARAYSTRRHDQNATNQRIEVMEGRWASIDMTLQVPVVEQTVDVTGGQERVLNAIKYKDLSTGFAVRATISGDHAVIDIMPHKAALDTEQGGTIKSQAATTTVRGKTGEWIDIGGAVGDIVEHEQGTISTGGRHGDDERHILLKVEVL